jgi:serine/threonine protein phosphatase PrpC
MRFLICKESRKGPRATNQDRVAYAASDEALIMVLADGMGGHLNGDVAAHIAVEFLLEAFRKQAGPRLADPHRFLIDGITNAHLAIGAYAEDKGLLETPRTTCVVCVVQQGTAYWAHAGDSRLYLVREGRVAMVTKDHTRIQQLIDMGRVREEAAAHHPDRNKVFNCLGQINLPRIDISRPVPLMCNDTVLLCSDGLWGPVGSRGLVQGLLEQGLLEAVPALLDAAQSRAGPAGDNLSAVALTWLEEAGAVAHSRAAALSSVPPADLGRTGTGTVGSVLPGEGEFLSDEEIEQAIDEIRGAIRRAVL